MLVQLDNATAAHTAEHFGTLLNRLDAAMRLSMTYDNGKEMAHHQTLTQSTGIRVFFAHPYSPWERGINENTNGLPLKAAVVRREALARLEDLPGWANTVIGDLLSEVARLDERIGQYDQHIRSMARQSTPAQQLMQLVGMGETTATALVSTVGHGHDFACGRQFCAWLGRVPGHYSAGGKQRLGRITKAGDPYLRSLLVMRARSVLALAHRQHGRLPWARLFDPAIALAEQGFAVSPRLHTLLRSETALRADPVAAVYLYRADGQPHPVGHVLKNPELAAVLREIAERGPGALLEGKVANAIIDKVRQHPNNPGQLSADDLRRYQPREREALCFDHQTLQRALRICGFPPPSSGAVAIGQILGLLARTAQGAGRVVFLTALSKRWSNAATR